MFFLIGAGVVFAVALLLIAFNIDSNPIKSARQWREGDVTELLPPGALGPNAATGDLKDLRRNMQGLGAENTWIQTTKDGKLSQQYRFASHDPNPEGLPAGWSKVTNPEIQMFMADDRVVTLQSETALLRAPSGRAESGRMMGAVVIRMYELDESQAFDATALRPAVEAHTDAASFDNIQGEVRSDGEVDIQSETVHLTGSGLRIQINEVADRVEWLRLENVQGIRLAAAASEEGPFVDAAPARTVESAPPAHAVPELQAPNTKPQQRPAPSRAKSSPKRKAQLAETGPTFYRLTLQKKVRLHQKSETSDWTATGDELHIIFSMEGQTAPSPTVPEPSKTELQSAAPSGRHDGSIAHNLREILLALALLTPAPTGAAEGLFIQSDDDIFITCEGGMTMVPLGEKDERPASPRDSRLQLVGSPVHLRSNADEADIRCGQFDYHTLQRRLYLNSSAAYPLTIDSPELRGIAEQFWLSRSDNIGGFRGAGWLVLREKADPQVTTPPVEPDASQQDVRIEWAERVDMAFHAAAASAPGKNGAMGKLRSAEFVKNVNVESDEILLRADSMKAGFPPESSSPAASNANARPGLESIEARGSVHARSRADDGAINCDELDVAFASTSEGRSVPQQMTAKGNVASIDKDKQTVWSDSLDIAFQPPDVQDAGAASGSAQRYSARVKSGVAESNVQALTVDGARVCADRLEGDAQSESVVFEGHDVMVLNEQGVIHEGTRLELNKADNSAHWPGPGRFTYFTNPIAVATPMRMARPVVNQIDANQNPIQAQATWTDSMHYDGNFNEGAGALTLTGTVKAESWPTTQEYNDITGQSLTLQFVRAEGAEAAPADAAQPVNAFNQGGQRQLKLFIAEGGGGADAKITNRTWLKADHSDLPRIYYIAGPRIEYDDQTLESRVPGAGVLLVRDERPGAPVNNDSVPFSSKGTTQFKWTQQLQMIRKPHGANLYDIDMIGGVEVRHMALDRSFSTMTGDRLEATVERLAHTNADGAQRQGTIDLGGAMDLRRIRTSGNVLIKSPTRTIDCEELDYDYVSGDAVLAALPGRMVSVLTVGNPNPLRAERVLWNLITDRVTATNVRGATPR